MRVWITGLGCISALGDTVAEHLERLKAQRSGVGTIERLDTRHKGTMPLCEVPHSDEALQQQLTALGMTPPASRTALLALIAARQAWQQAGSPNLDTGKTGVFSGNTVGGMDRTERFFSDFLADAQTADASVLHTHECGDSTERIAHALGASGMVATISTACSSAANAIMLGARLIRNGQLDRAIVGGVDALTKFTLNGFNVLQILDEQPSQPFDGERRGLNLGEGAGFLVLEAEHLAAPEQRLAELVGYANSNDAYHQTASSPDGTGAYAAMKGALDVANIAPTAVDYINVHGTGTPNNDLSEGIALQRLFGDALPPFSSTKAYTGHTLGAAGGIESVFSVLALLEQLIFPNLRFQTPMPELDSAMIPETTLRAHPITYVLSNSFGFGGNTSSLVFKKAPDL